MAAFAGLAALTAGPRTMLADQRARKQIEGFAWIKIIANSPTDFTAPPQ